MDLVSNKPVFVAIVVAMVYNYIHNYQYLLTREPQNEIHNVMMT